MNTEQRVRRPEELWLDYRFLTKEMLKFLSEQDMDLFYELLDQRETLQKVIDQTADDGFKMTPKGRSLLQEIRADSQAVLQALRVQMSKSKRQHEISEAYGVASTSAVNMMHRNRY